MIRAAWLLAGALVPATALAAPQLAPVWTDHAVIQRDRPIVIEGTAEPGELVTATLGRVNHSATAGPDGRFSITLAARSASATPETLTVSDSSGTVTVSDIVIGDVWLCSGQSNMAFTVSAGLNGFNNIQASTDPLLRMLTIPLDTSAKPMREFSAPAAWQVASPQTTGAFSAACYYMLKDLRAELAIPMGAIHSSWGGSAIRAWLGPEGGLALYGSEAMALLDAYERDPLAATTQFAPTWETWWRKQSGQEPWNDPSVVKWQPVPAIAPWGTWEGTPLASNGNGNVLLRHTIELTPEQAASGGTLGIGVIDDLDATWVNGRAVGITQSWSKERHYRVPPGYLKAGDNEVLVIASNSWGAGGFQSQPDRLFFEVEGGERLPLAEGWQYSIGTPTGMPPRAPWDTNAGIGVMHNRMIAPLGSIALAGAAWYQGESDVGISGYQDRLRELFAGWRRQFGPEMRVLVVQLANYGPVATKPVESGWASLREDQRQAVLADANAVLVTAIDIGDRTDIHPANKVELGRRLALAARGAAMPMPVAISFDGTGYRLRFSGVEGALESWSGFVSLGVEACGDAEHSCRYVLATPGGDSLHFAPGSRLPQPSEGPITRIRYAWADSPVVNTYDRRGIPLPGFEFPVEP